MGHRLGPPSGACTSLHIALKDGASEKTWDAVRSSRPGCACTKAPASRRQSRTSLLGDSPRAHRQTGSGFTVCLRREGRQTRPPETHYVETNQPRCHGTRSKSHLRLTSISGTRPELPPPGNAGVQWKRHVRFVRAAAAGRSRPYPTFSRRIRRRPSILVLLAHRTTSRLRCEGSSWEPQRSMTKRRPEPNCEWNAARARDLTVGVRAHRPGPRCQDR